MLAARKAYGLAVNACLGVISASLPTVTPKKYCVSNGKVNGVLVPRMTLNSPLVTVTVCVSVKSAVPPVEALYNRNTMLTDALVTG